jgi:hypothetical protein
MTMSTMSSSRYLQERQLQRLTGSWPSQLISLAPEDVITEGDEGASSTSIMTLTMKKVGLKQTRASRLTGYCF